MSEEAWLGLNLTLIASEGPSVTGCCGRAKLQKTMFLPKSLTGYIVQPCPVWGPGGDCRGLSARWQESLGKQVSRLTATCHIIPSYITGMLSPPSHSCLVLHTQATQKIMDAEPAPSQ